MPRKPTGRPPGRPKGLKDSPTSRRGAAKRQKVMEQAAAAEFTRQYITARLEPILEAQLDNAVGIKYLMARDRKGGRWKRLESLPKPGQQVGTDDEIVEVYAKDPSVHAAVELLMRALGKARDTVDLNARGDLVLRWADREGEGA